MIKLVTVLKRREGMTRPEFETRWLGIHAPIAAEFPKLRGYVLSFSIEEGEPSADGVAQLWFDDRRSAQWSYATDIGRNGSNDAKQYLGRRDHLLVSERWIERPSDGAARPFKLLVGIKRPGGESRAGFVARMAAADDAALRAALDAAAVRLCVDEAGQQLNSGVSGALDLFESEACFDAMLEAWYPDADALRRAAGRLEGSDALAALVAGGSRETILLNENIVVAPPEHVQPAALLAGKKH